MPQFAVETFSSQVVWVLVGFFAIYIFVSFFVTPNLQKTFSDRERKIGGLLGRSDELNSAAQKVSDETQTILEKSRVEVAAVESKLISSLQCQNIKEKEKLELVFQEESRKESEKLARLSEECFGEIAGEVGGIVRVAVRKLS